MEDKERGIQISIASHVGVGKTTLIDMVEHKLNSMNIDYAVVGMENVKPEEDRYLRPKEVVYQKVFQDLTESRVYSSQGKTSEEVVETRNNNIIESIRNHMKKNGTTMYDEIQLAKNKQSKLSKREREYLLSL